jgi:hypothetical protein
MGQRLIKNAKHNPPETVMEGEITGSDLAKQLDAYSNAIVGFVVLQSLTYAYSFGTNEMFNCLVKTAKHLAFGLSLHFALATVLLTVATIYLSNKAQALSGGYAEIVRKIYVGKLIAVILFSLLPLALTVGYGVLDYPTKYECKHAAPSAVVVPTPDRLNRSLNDQTFDTSLAATHQSLPSRITIRTGRTNTPATIPTRVENGIEQFDDRCTG